MNCSRFASQLPRSIKYKKVANNATRVQTRKDSAMSASADLLKDSTITSMVSNSLLESEAEIRLSTTVREDEHTSERSEDSE